MSIDPQPAQHWSARSLAATYITAQCMFAQLPVGRETGCGGVVEGFGGVMGNAHKPNAVSDGQTCELLLKLEPHGKLNIEESRGCSYFHGADCGFSDTLTRI